MNSLYLLYLDIYNACKSAIGGSSTTNVGIPSCTRAYQNSGLVSGLVTPFSYSAKLPALLCG